jgi:hypothetical protein
MTATHMVARVKPRGATKRLMTAPRVTKGFAARGSRDRVRFQLAIMTW